MKMRNDIEEIQALSGHTCLSVILSQVRPWSSENSLLGSKPALVKLPIILPSLDPILETKELIIFLLVPPVRT